METNIANVLAATMNQTNLTESDWFNGFKILSTDTNHFNIQQTVTNNISQLNQTTCSANTTVSQQNNFVYVSNGSAGNDFVGVGQNVNASASCVMNNTMQSITYNQAGATGASTNTEKGMFVAMAGIFAGIIGMVIIIVIVLFAVGVIGYVGYGAVKAVPKGKGGTGATEGPPEGSEEALAESLGISPDIFEEAVGAPASTPAPPATAPSLSSSFSSLAATAASAVSQYTSSPSFQQPISGTSGSSSTSSFLSGLGSSSTIPMSSSFSSALAKFKS